MKDSMRGAHRSGLLRRLVVGGAAVTIGSALFLSAGVAGATTKIVTKVGNGGHGKIVSIANAAAGKLVGPKGSGLTRGVTATSIKIGCVTTTQSYAEYQTGIEARIAQTNKAGGVNGRKITFVTCKNDNGSVQTNTTANEQLVTQDTVFGVITLSEFETPGATNFLNSHQVPYFGWGFMPGFCGYRWGFGWDGCLGGNSVPQPVEAVAGYLGQAILKAYTKTTGKPASTARVAVQDEGSAAGKVGQAEGVAAFAKTGAKLVYNAANYPATASGVNPTPYVQAILASKPNIVYIETNFTNVAPLAGSLRAAGYTGILMDFTNYIPGLLQAVPALAKALTGEFVNTQVIPNETKTGTHTKYVGQITAALSAIGKTPFVTLGAFMGYAEATMFIAMLKKAGKNLTTKSFTKAVNGGFTSYKGLKGGPGLTVWPADHYLPTDCAAMVQVKNGAYTVVEPYSCYTTNLITQKHKK